MCAVGSSRVCWVNRHPEEKGYFISCSFSLEDVFVGQPGHVYPDLCSQAELAGSREPC